MAALHSHLSRFVAEFPLRSTNYPELDRPLFLLRSFFVFFVVSALAISLHLYKRLRRIELQFQQLSKPVEPQKIDGAAGCGNGTDRAGIARSLKFEVLTPESPKWASFFGEEGRGLKGVELKKEDGESGQEQGGKRKKKRARKKRAGENDAERDLNLLYPFASPTSVIQRRIKLQYDELLRCQESKELTVTQVKQFANCLISTRKKLQHKGDFIHRKFTITKALLSKADRSSIDRLQQQIYKLELEHKRLEEDTFFYNWLQQQLMLSPAYKKMLENGPCVEPMEKPEKPTVKINSGFIDTSFEELLEREKKDSFWQRNGKLRSCTS